MCPRGILSVSKLCYSNQSQVVLIELLAIVLAPSDFYDHINAGPPSQLVQICGESTMD